MMSAFLTPHPRPAHWTDYLRSLPGTRQWPVREPAGYVSKAALRKQRYVVLSAHPVQCRSGVHVETCCVLRGARTADGHQVPVIQSECGSGGCCSLLTSAVQPRDA